MHIQPAICMYRTVDTNYMVYNSLAGSHTMQEDCHATWKCDPYMSYSYSSVCVYCFQKLYFMVQSSRALVHSSSVVS